MDRLASWIVTPIVIPILIALSIVAAAVYQW